MVSRHVRDNDTGLFPATLERLNNIQSLFCRCALDPGFEIIPFLEVDVDDVVATDDTVQRNRTAVNIDSVERGDLSRLGNDVVCNVLKVLQFAGQLLDRKSTRLNSSHVSISYAVFCLKKKK